MLPGECARVAGGMCKGCRGNVQNLSEGHCCHCCCDCEGGKTKSTPSLRFRLRLEFDNTPKCVFRATGL